ncbi:MAG: hypothetical protein HY549_06975 [Elusimicrobia bacterium]|nr:hypothetical protein [Elusimicrobiota bacterium]
MRNSLALLPLTLLWGCSEQDVTVHRLAKQTRGHVAAHNPASSNLHWKAPEGWKEEPGSGMRVASFRTPLGAELSVVSLPGEAGGALANVNRWRGQLGLKEIAAEGLASSSRKLGTPIGEALLVDINPNRKAGLRMLAAILSFRDQSWFFKMTGDSKAVEQAASGFESFLRSLHEAH